MSDYNWYAGNDFYTVGDKRNRRRDMLNHKEDRTLPPAPDPTPEEWAEIDRKRAELQERLKELGRKYDGDY